MLSELPNGDLVAPDQIAAEIEGSEYEVDQSPRAYKIFQSFDAAGLEELVNTALEAGWTLVGGMCCTCKSNGVMVFCQAAAK
jgi:hypothetical protein